MAMVTLEKDVICGENSDSGDFKYARSTRAIRELLNQKSPSFLS